MQVLLPSADTQKVTVNVGKGYDVTYYKDPKTTTSKVTEHLMFLVKDELNGVPESVGLRFIDITKSDVDLADYFRAICAKDILRITPRVLGDTVIEGLTDMQACDGEVENALSTSTGVTQTLIYK